MLTINQIKKRFRSGSYSGVPNMLLEQFRKEIAKDDYWRDYPNNRRDVLARLCQTLLRYGWCYPGEKLYWRTCEEIERIFLGTTS